MLVTIATMMLQAVSPPVQAAAPVPVPATKCRRSVETGTLARVRKVCHTVQDWRRIDGNGRDTTAEMQRPGVSPPANN
ncbi:hypothetical protein FSB78_04025 [Sphingomonas ginsenosidivorax]|uniref:Secreted protein n=1 Tax=Sphingomonas ginsenosidivorax TaxID=862135 RepID=A0A5C6UC32_9SPHN|nr:hypothetical protein [Sphingomonas ginsenosidivorax]TXC70204.1 hypothetical protein FSB78_04025 [Sphingomonas ginsenosidivorax]